MAKKGPFKGDCSSRKGLVPYREETGHCELEKDDRVSLHY